MGEPTDPVFERRVRREIHQRYKTKAAAFQELYTLCQRQKARIETLEMQLAEYMDTIELAEHVISDGTVDHGEPEQLADSVPAAAGIEDRPTA